MSKDRQDFCCFPLKWGSGCNEEKWWDLISSFWNPPADLEAKWEIWLARHCSIFHLIHCARINIKKGTPKSPSEQDRKLSIQKSALKPPFTSSWKLRLQWLVTLTLPLLSPWMWQLTPLIIPDLAQVGTNHHPLGKCYWNNYGGNQGNEICCSSLKSGNNFKNYTREQPR